MTSQNQATTVKLDKQSQRSAEPAVVAEPAGDLAAPFELPSGPIAAAGGGAIKAQANWLRPGRLQSAQRHALAAQIGRGQGNHHLQRVIAAANSDKKAAPYPTNNGNGLVSTGGTAAVNSSSKRMGDSRKIGKESSRTHKVVQMEGNPSQKRREEKARKRRAKKAEKAAERGLKTTRRALKAVDDEAKRILREIAKAEKTGSINDEKVALWAGVIRLQKLLGKVEFHQRHIIYRFKISRTISAKKYKSYQDVVDKTTKSAFKVVNKINKSKDYGHEKNRELAEAINNLRIQIDLHHLILESELSKVVILGEVVETPSIRHPKKISTIKLPQGDSPGVFISEKMQNLITWEQVFWGHYRDGVKEFTDAMVFSSEQEAKSQYLDAVFKATAEAFVDNILRNLPPGIKEIARSIKAGAKALLEEKKRVETAKGDVKIVKYIGGLIDSIGDQEIEKLDELMKLIPQMKNKYYSLDPDYPENRQPSPEGVIVGPCAKYLNDLERTVEAFKENIPDARLFQQQITEKLAATSGLTGPISRGGRPTGKLYLDMQVIKIGNDWTLEEIDDAWTLVTKYPEETRKKLAASLKSSLKRQPIYKTNLPKWVRILLIIESSRGWRDYYHGTIVFTKEPDNFEVKRGDSHMETSELMRQVFTTDLFKRAVLNVNDLKGSADQGHWYW